jgi:short-subunit dehydrogenase
MVTNEKHGPWALIVGGSEGIGEALSDKLGGIGINLVLVARRPEPLEATAVRVRESSGVEVRTLSLDVSLTDAVERICELTDGVEIGLLIHNVGGGGGFGPLLERSLDENMRAVMANCVNFLKLVHHYGQAMKARGRAASSPSVRWQAMSAVQTLLPIPHPRPSCSCCSNRCGRSWTGPASM